MSQVEILDERNEIALQARQVAKDLALVEAELAAAEPAMRAAVRSLQKITQSDISTVRTFSRYVAWPWLNGLPLPLCPLLCADHPT